MLTKIFITIVAIEHLYFLCLQMFLWTKPLGLKTFKMTEEYAQSSKVLAANQGLYNGFLATGLLIGAYNTNAVSGFHIQLIFISFVLAAAFFGGITHSRRILLIQGSPALIAFAALLFHW